MKQSFENIPAEIKNSRRFFLVAENKRPLQKDWSNPKVQKSYTEINGLAGFDTVGHGVADDYLFLDFDHVLNADGDFVNNSVEDLFGELVLSFKNLYVERSVSGTGLHVFLKPTAGNFETVSNGKLGVYHFDDNTAKDAPKLELFYGSGGRYCLLTGDLFECDEGAELNIPAGVEVDDYLTKLLADIQAQLQERGINPARNTENISANATTETPVLKNAAGGAFEEPQEPAEYTRDLAEQLPNSQTFGNLQEPAEYTRDLAVACLDVIDPAALNDTDWLAVMSACKNLGVAESIVDRFNQRDLERYNAAENKTRWDSLTDSSFGIEVLIGKSQDNGFDFKAFKRQWYKDHPQYQKARFESEENKLAADIKAFEEEKHSAIEYLNNLETFDRKTVTDEKTLKTAAFAKLFDAQAFSKFKVDLQRYGLEHPAEKVTLPDITSAMKDFITDINSRRFELERRSNVLKATKKTTNFFAANDFLNNFNCPQNYSIFADGVFEQRGDKYFQICYTPIVISDKYYNLDTKKYSLRLAFKPVKKWRYSPIVSPAIVANKHKLTDLAVDDLPVSSVNAYDLIKYFDAFKAANAENIPVTCLVDKCGWRNINGKLEFIDPRRNVSIVGEEGQPHPVKPAETSFTKALKSVGSLDQWRNVYNKVKEYPVARAIVAAAVASLLLEIVGERNFVFYVWTDTTSGKTAALTIAASAVGTKDLMIVFDGTNNGILATLNNHYSSFIDEKQLADDKLAANFTRFVYQAANGEERQRANKDGTARPHRTWQNITICNGETELLDDSATGGAFRRLLSIAAPSPILPPDICKKIYDTVKENYGLALPLVIDKIFEYGFENLRDMFNDLVEEFQKKYPAIVFEHCRYIAILTLGDFLLNVALGVEENQAYDDAVESMINLFKYIPTKAEITDSSRARDLVLGFIAQNQKLFIGALNLKAEDIPKFFGKINDDGCYITVEALKLACKESKTDYKALVKWLKADGFFIPNEKGEYAANERIGSISPRCFKIDRKYLSNVKASE